MEGIGVGIGSILEAAGDAGDKVIGSLGRAIKDTFSGAGSASNELVRAIGDSSAEIIDAGGNAVKNSAEGVSYIFREIFGGLPNLLIWIVLLPLIGYIGYLKFTGQLGHCHFCHQDPDLSISAPIPESGPGVIVGKLEPEAAPSASGPEPQTEELVPPPNNLEQMEIYSEMIPNEPHYDNRRRNQRPLPSIPPYRGTFKSTQHHFQGPILTQSTNRRRLNRQKLNRAIEFIKTEALYDSPRGADRV